MHAVKGIIERHAQQDALEAFLAEALTAWGAADPETAAQVEIQRRRDASVREAGHVIVGHGVGLICYRASIRPAPPWGSGSSQSEYLVKPGASGTGGKTLWRRLGRWRRAPGERARQLAVSSMGGLVAERLVLTDKDPAFLNAGCGGDCERAAHWLGLSPVWLPAVGRWVQDRWRPEFVEPAMQAADALYANRAAFARIVRALMARTTLSEREITHLID